MSKTAKIRQDQTETMKRVLDRMVAEGALHAALVVTYPGGKQVIMRSTEKQPASSLPLASGFL